MCNSGASSPRRGRQSKNGRTPTIADSTCRADEPGTRCPAVPFCLIFLSILIGGVGSQTHKTRLRVGRRLGTSRCWQLGIKGDSAADKSMIIFQLFRVSSKRRRRGPGNFLFHLMFFPAASLLSCEEFSVVAAVAWIRAIKRRVVILLAYPSLP